MGHRGDPTGLGPALGRDNRGLIGLPVTDQESFRASGFAGRDLRDVSQIQGAQGAGLLDLFSISGGPAGPGGRTNQPNIAQVAQGVLDISSGIESLSAGRKSDRESKRARDIIASRARVEFQQRGVLARRLLARQRAQFAAAGVAPGGTQAAVQEFTSFQRSLERRLILNDALELANRIRRQGRRAGKRAKRSGTIGVIKGIGDIFAGFGGSSEGSGFSISP